MNLDWMGQVSQPITRHRTLEQTVVSFCVGVPRLLIKAARTIATWLIVPIRIVDTLLGRLNAPRGPPYQLPHLTPNTVAVDSATVFYSPAEVPWQIGR